MPITVTPTLSTKTGYVEDVRDQVATLVRFVIMNPGRTSEIWEDSMLSFRNMSSRDEHLREGFATKLGSRIQSTLESMFTDYGFNCDFTTSDYEEGVSDGRYTVTFSIMMTPLTSSGSRQEIPALISGSIKVDRKTNEIDLTYDQTLDSYSL